MDPTEQETAGESTSESTPVEPASTVSLEETGQQVQSILAAAQRTADQTMEAVKAEASRYIAAQRKRADQELSERMEAIAASAESLIDHGQLLNREIRKLVNAMQDATREIENQFVDAGREARAPSSAAGHDESSPPDEAGVSEPGDSPSETEGGRPLRGRFRRRRSNGGPRELSPELLAALQMKNIGESRSEAHSRLAQMGVENPDDVLDAVHYGVD